MPLVRISFHEKEAEIWQHLFICYIVYILSFGGDSFAKYRAKGHSSTTLVDSPRGSGAGY